MERIKRLGLAISYVGMTLIIGLLLHLLVVGIGYFFGMLLTQAAFSVALLGLLIFWVYKAMD